MGLPKVRRYVRPGGAEPAAAPRIETSPAPTAEYHPTCVVVCCTACYVLGTLEFPSGFSYRTGDAVMHRDRPFRGKCGRCDRVTEMVAVDYDREKDNGLTMVKKIQDRLREQVGDPDAEPRL